MDTASEIFKVAWRLFLERGYEATNIRNICKEVGVGLPTLYYHFQSKEALFLKLYDHCWSQYLDNYESRQIIKMDLRADLKLFLMFKEDVEYLSQYEDDFKFNLRCTMFPPIELKETLYNKKMYYQRRRETIIRNIFEEAIEQKIIDKKNFEVYLKRHEMFVFNQIINKVFNKELLTNESLESLWENFFKCKVGQLS
ncbi:hypothetical protein SDC9_101421 [bioreactor metagenome]|uniref:HTH tetR-type domain-containing protein n=1 Tax=bioreactor metagenome TaxID=1076179 RepID=A0A645AN25_9ZZZZ